MKFLKKYWFKILSITLISIISIYVCFFAFKQQSTIYTKPITSTKVYSIWHIETFEGGGKARIDYLKSVANHLEKQNKNILFYIKEVKPEILKSELSVSKPDIISFGYGVGKDVLPFLTPIASTYNIRDELLISGMFNNCLYSVPYIISGYAEIKHSEQASEICYGLSSYTKPEKLGYKATKLESSYEAYKQFVYNTNLTLIGTGRDVFRVNNLNNLGRLNATITPINYYTDLIQYIGLVNPSSIAVKFIELTLSEQFQLNLVNYSLFSSLYNKIYFSGIYNDMENAILSCKIAKVFNE